MNDVRSSTVHPKTFPPNASGATSNPELPRLRFLIRVLRFANRASVPIKTPANFGLDAFFPGERTRTDKNCSTLKEGLRSISFAQVCAQMMFVIL